MLFGVEFHAAEDLPEQMGIFEELEGYGEEDRAYLEKKCRGVIEKIGEIDAAVNEVSQDWKTKRMGKVDLTLIRLAAYEMKYDEDVPVGVAINEAVELAKKYGTEESPSFVNGVLAKLA